MDKLGRIEKNEVSENSEINEPVSMLNKAKSTVSATVAAALLAVSVNVSADEPKSDLNNPFKIDNTPGLMIADASGTNDLGLTKNDITQISGTELLNKELIEQFQKDSNLSDDEKAILEEYMGLSKISEKNRNVVENVYVQLKEHNPDANEKAIKRVADKYAQLLNDTYGNTDNFYDYISTQTYQADKIDRINREIKRRKVSLSSDISELTKSYKILVESGDNIIRKVAEESQKIFDASFAELDFKSQQAQETSKQAQETSKQAQETSKQAQETSKQAQEISEAMKIINGSFNALKHTGS